MSNCPCNQTGRTDRLALPRFPLAILLLLSIQACQPEKSDKPPASRPADKVAPGPDMVLVEGGTFQMGDQFSQQNDDETPVHNVTVSNFYCSKYEVTFDEFDAFCTATGREKPGDEGWGRGRRPVVRVSWYDAIEYCNWRSQQDNRQPVYSIDKAASDPDNRSRVDNQKWTITADWNANGYRLPTEAEWEFAARERGRRVRFGNGRDQIDPAAINFDAQTILDKTFPQDQYRQKTVPVDSLSANSLGLHHMSGNVWEWCWDWHDGAYYAQSDNAQNPHGPPSGIRRVCRGGSWLDGPAQCRAASRGRQDFTPYYPYTQDKRYKMGGFRLAHND